MRRQSRSGRQKTPSRHSVVPAGTRPIPLLPSQLKRWAIIWRPDGLTRFAYRSAAVSSSTNRSRAGPQTCCDWSSTQPRSVIPSVPRAGGKKCGPRYPCAMADIYLPTPALMENPTSSLSAIPRFTVVFPAPGLAVPSLKTPTPCCGMSAPFSPIAAPFCASAAPAGGPAATPWSIAAPSTHSAATSCPIVTPFRVIYFKSMPQEDAAALQEGAAVASEVTAWPEKVVVIQAVATATIQEGNALPEAVTTHAEKAATLPQAATL